MALIEWLEKLSEEIDNKLFTTWVLIDLKTAFDTIDHYLRIKEWVSNIVFQSRWNCIQYTVCKNILKNSSGIAYIIVNKLL